MPVENSDESVQDRRSPDLSPIYRLLGQLEGRVHGIETSLSDVKTSMCTFTETIKELTKTVNELSVKLTLNMGKEIGADKTKAATGHSVYLIFTTIATVAAILSAYAAFVKP